MVPFIKLAVCLTQPTCEQDSTWPIRATWLSTTNGEAHWGWAGEQEQWPMERRQKHDSSVLALLTILYSTPY